MRFASLAAAIAICALGATGAMSTHAPPQTVADNLMAEINVVRERHGLTKLRADPKLSTAAMDHAIDMVERDFFDHRAPDGTSLSGELHA